MANDSYKISQVGQAMYNLLVAGKAGLGLADVFYGDQQLIPRFPATCVETGTKSRELAGVGGKGRTDNHFEIFVLYYVGMLQDNQLNRLAAEQGVEAVEDYLHTDVNMGGTVLHGYVTRIEPGYVAKGNNILRVSRIAWTGYTKTMIV